MSKTLVCILGLALTSPVFAANTPESAPAQMDTIGKPRAMNPAAMHEMMMQRFNQADADKSGSLTKAEAETTMPMLAQHFDEIDTNHDGQVSRAELQAAFSERMQQQKAAGNTAK
ncbi:MAG: EF-hand domain-containing protein [Sulfuriferula sp.]|nr:EF-hand domain-containing protein [Sulfuriferula sp.]